MTPQDLIKAKEEASSVQYQSFILLYTSHPNDLFCFLEGKDAPYYHFRIKSVYSGETHYITCSGKKNVLKVKEIIENQTEYTLCKTAFFIDKDFDYSIKGTSINLYETPCYSIENLYCSPKSVKEVLKCEFQLLESDAEFKIIYALYIKLLNDYSEAILMFNAWYSLQKEKAKILGITTKVNLDSTLPKGYVSVSLEKIEGQYDLEKIKKQFKDSINVDINELDNRITQLRIGEIHQNLRGKYVFDFLISFIRQLIDDANNKDKQKFLSKKTKFNIDNKTALSTLSPYAETPVCLKKFIHEIT